MKKVFLFILLQLFCVQLFAQNNLPEMATDLRSSGKIYVVVVCVAVILLGIIAFLFSIDRRLSNVEKKQKVG
ncbi:MAG: CcmD family protein [Sphingobacteriaceae bacterium]|nr:CcmD family protein [Sphingobacteriaceae bacterium]